MTQVLLMERQALSLYTLEWCFDYALVFGLSQSKGSIFVFWIILFSGFELILTLRSCYVCVFVCTCNALWVPQSINQFIAQVMTVHGIYLFAGP